MSRSISAKNSTKTEDKDQQFAALLTGDSSLPATFTQRVDMQHFKHRNNKEVPLSCGLEDSFHVNLTMREGELSAQSWSPDFSPFQPPETLCSEAAQAFDSVSRLDEFGFETGFLFGERKESASRPPSTFRQRSAYKYDDLSAAVLANQRTDDHVGSSRKQSSPRGLICSPRSACTMSYHEHWPSRFPSYSVQPTNERMPLSPSSPHTSIQRDYITPLVGARRASEQNVTTHLPSAQFGPGLASQSQHTTISSACGGYPEQSTTAPLSSPPSHPPPMHILRSQSEGSILPSWPTQPLEMSPYHYSSPDQNQPHEPQQWWAASSSPNRNTQQYGHPGYLMVLGSASQQPRLRMNHTPVLGHGSGLTLQGHQQAELPSTSERLVKIPPPSCPDPSPTYQPQFSQDSFQRQQSYEPMHRAPSYTSSVPLAPGVAPTRSSRTASTNPIHRSPKSRHQTTAHHRRVNTRKASYSGISTSKAGKATPTHGHSNSTSMTGNKSPISVSFVNFTPEDSQKLLSGVAPSGSSKTKARREQEAREKRRQLSEAALMAVRRAGGDVEALEAVIC